MARAAKNIDRTVAQRTPILNKIDYGVKKLVKADIEQLSAKVIMAKST